MHRQANKSDRIGVLMGGMSAERDISLETGASVLDALQQRGYTAIGIDVDDQVCERLRAERIDVVFVALHGRYGEDGCIQGLLESLRIPYTGSGVLASAMAMDKVVTKRLLDAASIPTAPWTYPATEASVLSLGLPAVLKPRAEGSSVGVHLVSDPAELVARLAGAGTAVMAERFVAGRELSLALLGHGAQVQCLGAVEIESSTDFYDYQAKYQRTDTQYIVPPQVPADVAARFERYAIAAHQLLECRGATRVDFRWDEHDEPMVLEINTLPGMTSHSLLPKIAAHHGIGYGELVELILHDAALKA